MALTRADNISTGELALAIGRRSEGPIASLGMVAVAGGPWEGLRGGGIDRLIRLDRGIDPRQEGGLLVNAEGGWMATSEVHSLLSKAFVRPGSSAE